MKQINDLEKKEMQDIYGSGDWVILNGEWIYVDIIRGKES